MSGAHVPIVESLSLDSSEDEERQGSAQDCVAEEWPEELQFLQGKRFGSDHELQEELEKHGLGDARVLVGSDGFVQLKMPGPRHNRATSSMHRQFTLWAQGLTGEWGLARNESTNIYYRDARGQVHKRCPDVSFWGMSRLSKNSEGEYRPRIIPGGSEGIDMEPHVVIQFSSHNGWLDEEGAMNYMMDHDVVHPGNELVQVGYLIKVRHQGGRPVGFKIFRVPRGQRMPRRDEPTSEYTHGGNDVKIVIKAADLGYTGFTAWRCGSFKLSMKDVWSSMLSEY